MLEGYRRYILSLNRDQLSNKNSSWLNGQEKVEQAEEPSVEIDLSQMDIMELLVKYNSDPLPPRQYPELSLEDMCETREGLCANKSARIPPLIAVSLLLLQNAENDPEAVRPYRLLTCLHQKTMSTMLNAIFCTLLQNDDFLQANHSLTEEKIDKRYCGKSNKFISVEHVRTSYDLTEDEMLKWRGLMITRNPVDRFLSGYLDRCIRLGYGCYHCGYNMTCFLEIETARGIAFSLNNGNPPVTREDIHYYPQIWHCDIFEWPHYEFVKYASSNMTHKITQILQERKVPENRISFIAKSLSRTRTLHSTVTSPSRKFFENRLKSSPYLLELLVRLTYFDYKLLGYSLPNI